MVKLSAELIEQAAQYTNPVRDRELDLRGESIVSLLTLKVKLLHTIRPWLAIARATCT